MRRGTLPKILQNLVLGIRKCQQFWVNTSETTHEMSKIKVIVFYGNWHKKQ